MHRSNLFFVCVLACAVSTPAYSLDQAKDLLISTKRLNDDWQNQKVQYKKRFKQQLGVIEKEIKVLEHELDGGDSKKRDRINEKLADLRRAHADVTQVFNEITASSAVKWGNVPGDIKAAVDDMKD